MITKSNQASYTLLIQLIRDALDLCEQSLDKDAASAGTRAEQAALHAVRLSGCLAFEQGKVAALATKKARKSKRKAL